MNAVERSAERISSDLQRVVRDSEELLHTTSDALSEKAEEARKRLAATLNAAKATCRELREEAADRAKSADQLVRRNPYQTLGLALAAGILIGVVLKRK